MTNEEALTWLKNKQEMMKDNRWAFSSEDIEANTRAIEALDKIILEDGKEKHENPIQFSHVCYSRDLPWWA